MSLQFSIRALLVLLPAVACFFAGIRFERERQRRADRAAALAAKAAFEARLKSRMTLSGARRKTRATSQTLGD